MKRFKPESELCSLIKERNDYLIVSKIGGVLSQPATKKEKDLQTFIKKKYPKSHLVSRLDRPVSGLMVFCKTSAFNKHLLRLQDNGQYQKTYLAIVEGSFKIDNTHFEGYHFHNKKLRKAYISAEQKKNFIPIKMDIKPIQYLERYTIVKIEISRAKFHQIRAVLSFLGHSIKGDVKYGARRSNKDKTILLHSFRHRFYDLKMNEIEFEAPLPKNDNLWNIVETNAIDG